MKDLPPGTSVLKSGANRIPLSVQLQNVINQLKIDKRIVEETSVPLSIQLQGVFEQLKVEKENNKENSTPRVSRWNSKDTTVPVPTHQSEVAMQLQTAIDQLKVEVADREKTSQNLSESSTDADIPATQVSTGLRDTMDPVLTAISYGEYGTPRGY